MLKPTVKRGLMTDFISDEIVCPEKIDQRRVFKLNTKGITDGDVVYLMIRELRLEDNWAIVFGQELAKKYNKTLKVKILLPVFNEKQKDFLFSNIEKLNLEIVKDIPSNAGAVIVDFNPINQLNLSNVKCAAFEVDSHNIIPARYISNKQEFSAATLRRKIYANIARFLTDFPQKNITLPDILIDFLNKKLYSYAEYKNDPNIDVTSHLSPYLHFGFISAQRAALGVINSNASRENKEVFLEELIVRKELADNYCLYNKNYNHFNGAPDWARQSLNAHRSDIRTYIYSLNEFKQGKTHDRLWNKIQQNLIKNGHIHGYLRMYWAKKILEWSKSPEDALKIAIYLNDTYALDGNDPNGYVGILWSIAGLHDRPFANRLVSGKIRYMSLGGCKKKFNLNEYLSKED